MNNPKDYLNISKEPILGDSTQEANSLTNKDFFVLKDVRAYLDIPLKARVQVLLLRKNITQNELAEKCSVSNGTMSEIVNGGWLPSSKIKMKMAEVLECDSLVLFGATPYWAEYSKKINYGGKNENKL